MNKNFPASSSTLLLREPDFLGKLIAVEGRDGAGKTTFVKYLQTHLDNLGYLSVRTKLPTNRVRQSSMFELFAHQGREDIVDALALQVLHMSDRLQHTHEFITPNLAAGKIVITDRYLSASLGAIDTRKLPRQWFNELCSRLWKPAIWIWLYAPTDVAIARIRQRPDEKNQYIDKNKFEQSLKLGLKIADQYGMTVLNTSELTLDQCWQAISKQLEATLVGVPIASVENMSSPKQ